MAATMVVVRACAAPSSAAADMTKTKRKSSSAARVLVLGGTGRVGGSTATALSNLRPDLSILVGGRNPEKGESFAAKLGEKSEFVQVDTRNASMLERALQGVDLVVHPAGPFERDEKCAVLEAAISTKTAYVDVCVNTDYSSRAKGFHEQAKAAGVPAITTAGIYSGDFLRDKNKVLNFVQLVGPLVRAVDGIAGERVSMRVDLECSNGRSTVGLFTHRKLSVSVGNATAHLF